MSSRFEAARDILLLDLRERYSLWVRSSHAADFLLTDWEIVHFVGGLHQYVQAAELQTTVDAKVVEFIATSLDHWRNQALKLWLQSNGKEGLLMDSSQLSLMENIAPIQQILAEHWSYEGHKDNDLSEFLRLSRLAETELRQREEERTEAMRQADPARGRMARMTTPEELADLHAQRRRRALAESKLDDAQILKLIEHDVPSGRVCESGTDQVDVSVFAPPKVWNGSEFFVQVMLHETGALESAGERATLVDDAAQLRGTSSLLLKLHRGSAIAVHLSVPGFEIDRPSQALVWNGALASVNFVVKASEISRSTCFPTIRIALGPAIIGELRFKLETEYRADPAEERQQKNATAATATSIKFARGVSDKDARELAPDMRTTPEFVHSMSKEEGGFNWSVFVRELTPRAIQLHIPYGTLEALPLMSEKNYAELRETIRRRYCETEEEKLSEPMPPHTPEEADHTKPDPHY